jgi:hypothetical protein
MDERMRAYYNRRAFEYDDWWLGTGLFEARERSRATSTVTCSPASVGPLWPRRGARGVSSPAPRLAAELGGGDVLHEGRWFVVVAA